LNLNYKDARVPIIKFDFEMPNSNYMNCDISMSRVETGFYMSKLFWTYSQMDARVAPFVFFVRAWAKLNQLTSEIRPSPHLTNFQITTLALCYLLRLEKPLIVPLDAISSFSNYGLVVLEERLTLAKVKAKLELTGGEPNRMALDELFVDFLRFYSMFDFDSYMVTLNTTLLGKIKKEKTQGGTLVIQNPFEPSLNAAVNVSAKELNRFVTCCRRSLEVIETLAEPPANGGSFDLDAFLNVVSNEGSSRGQTRPSDKFASVNDFMNL
jgi:DNA polymerase sigma